MFDIGFSELLLVFVIGLIVLGPQRLPVAVKNGGQLDPYVALAGDHRTKMSLPGELKTAGVSGEPEEGGESQPG